MTTEEAILNLYRDYIAMKSHFQGDLDITLGGISKSIGADQLVKRSDFKSFVLFVKEYGQNRKENLTVLTTLFVINPANHISECLTMDFEMKHNARVKTMTALPRVISREAAAIMEWSTRNSMSFRDAFFKSDTPPIIRNIKKIPGGVTDETLAIADVVLGYTQCNTMNPWWRKRKYILSRYALLLAGALPQEFIYQEFANALDYDLPTNPTNLNSN